MRLPRLSIDNSRSYAPLLFAVGLRGWAGWGAEFSCRTLRVLAVGVAPAAFLLQSSSRQQIYNILWSLVFGFATLNILSLGARRFERPRAGLSFGELLAILVVIVSLVLLGWEMLYVFHILPIKLAPR